MRESSRRWASCVVVSAVLAGCGNAPVTLQQMSLKDAKFQVAFLTSSQVDGGVSLDVELTSPGTSACPSVTATITANGSTFHEDSPGAVVQGCVENDFSGMGCAAYGNVCTSPSWSLVSPPSGPLSIVIEDSSQTLDIEAADMGTPRTLTVSTSNAGQGDAGVAQLAWVPAQDAEGWDPQTPPPGYLSSDFGPTQVTYASTMADGGSETLSWFVTNPGFTVNGANIQVQASQAVGDCNPLCQLASTLPWSSGQPGTFSATATSLVPVTTCALSQCTATFSGSADSSPTSWIPF